MIKLCRDVLEQLDPAYVSTAEGIRELQDIYEDCPIALYPDMTGDGTVVMKNPMVDEMPVCQKIDDYIRGRYTVHLCRILEDGIRTGKAEHHCGYNERSAIAISGARIESMHKSRDIPLNDETSALWLHPDDPVICIDVIMSAKVSVWNENGGFIKDREQTYSIQIYMNLATAVIMTDGEVHPGLKPKMRWGSDLDDYLIPYLNLQSMDAEAERILKRVAPRITGQPGYLDVKELLAALGMEVRFVRITKEFRFMGRVFFEDGEITVYTSFGREVPIRVRKGTILVDERLLMRTETVDWTIVHECYHYIQHREFFYLQKLYHQDLKCLSCQLKDISEMGKDSPLYWAEWQTERMTARLMMPLQSAKVKAREYLAVCQGRTDNMEMAIRMMSVFYRVSLQTAKHRMVEIGYPEARGVYNYVDNGYIPSYYGCELNKQKGTPDIPEDAGLELYLSDEGFRKLIDSGRYIYVENHFCLNDARYIIKKQNGEPALTRYARTHISECCIIFDKKKGEKRYTYSAGILNSEIIYTGPELYRPIDVPVSTPMSEEERIGSRMEIYLKAIEETPLRFGPAIRYHRESRGFTQEMLAELVSISSRQIGKYENSEVRKPVQRTVIAMCIAMKLETDLSDELLRKGGCMPGTEREDLILLYVLHALYEYSIHYCNRFLMKKGQEPLTKEVDEEGMKVS